MSLGQKDSHKSLFSVWQNIFTMPRPARYSYVFTPHKYTIIWPTYNLLVTYYVKIKIALSKDEVRILIKILVGDLGPS